MGGFDQQITFLSVEDLERSAAFYGGVLDLPLILDQGDCRIFGVAGAAFVGVCERPGAASPSGILVTFVTDEVDVWHDRLIAAGVPCDRPPALNPDYEVYHAFYRDPDGYLVEMQRFLDPRWPVAG